MKTKLIRADISFDKALAEIRGDRLGKKIDLDKKPRYNPELTKLLLTCPSFPKVREELTTLPLKRDLEKLWRAQKHENPK